MDEMTIVRDMGRVDALIGEEAACWMRLPGDDIMYGTPYMRWNGCRWHKESGLVERMNRVVALSSVSQTRSGTPLHP